MKNQYEWVKSDENTIVLKEIADFQPQHIFECGQCFRWNKQKDGSYTGVVKGKVVNIAHRDDQLTISNTNEEDFKNLWFDYFDLGRDYHAIKKILSKDPVMKEAIRFGQGIRLLKQEPWEALLTFIISSNNNIPRIRQIVSSISQTYGDLVQYENQNFYSFPAPDRLSDTSLLELNVCRGGYRCKYILETAKLMKQGFLEWNELKKKDTAEARRDLIKLPGVGPKVADCVLLYSGSKMDVFPADVWVKRVMEELYFHEETSLVKIQSFAKETFGELAGFAQQYLFYYARENGIGL